MNDVTHVTERQMLCALDGEMPAVERAGFDAHLSCCEACLDQYEALAELSNEIQRMVTASAADIPRSAREDLIRAMAAETAAPHRVLPRYGWRWPAAAAIAAALVLSFVLWGGKHRVQPAASPEGRQQLATKTATQLPSVHDNHASAPESANPIALVNTHHLKQPQAGRLGGQRVNTVQSSPFLPLPYTYASLPVQEAGLVRVRMQLSMLANAGVIRMAPGAPDAPVEADLLMGIDGQPYAVRLVSASQ